MQLAALLAHARHQQHGLTGSHQLRLPRLAGDSGANFRIQVLVFVVLTLLLGLLLRSVVAPLYLLATVTLSYLL